MKRFLFLALAGVLVSMISCGGDPAPTPAPAPAPKPAAAAPVETPVQQAPAAKTVQEPPKQESPVPAVVHSPEPEPDFDPATITQEEYDTAKQEVQQLIQKLNGIIRARNYDSWVSYLSRDYFSVISSKEYLDRINKTERMQKSRTVLNSARDYFVQVVVPSRANDRVDDIEFVSQNRVKAYTVANNTRLRLYDLEKTGDGWKIIN